MSAIPTESEAARSGRTAFGQHDLAWIRSHAPDDGSVRVDDVTSRYACLGLWGPQARELLQPLVVEALDFPYMRPRELAVGSVPRLALRVTYVGELGWELYCPSEYGLRLLGHALGGWTRAWARRRRLHLARGHSLRGRARLRGQARPGLHRPGGARRRGRARSLARLPRPRRPALGGARPEPVRLDGEIAGRVTSGGYGYTVERSIAYAYVPAAKATPGQPVEVEIFGEWVAGEVSSEPLFDPEGERIRV